VNTEVAAGDRGGPPSLQHEDVEFESLDGNLQLALGLVDLPTERERLVHLGVVTPFESSSRPHSSRTEEQEQDHGGDVRPPDPVPC
jgi:hypothetical protein